MHKNFCTFEIASLVNVPGHYLRKYSHLSNKRGGCNKPGGGAKDAKSISVEVGILQIESSPFAFK